MANIKQEELPLEAGDVFALAERAFASQNRDEAWRLYVRTVQLGAEDLIRESGPNKHHDVAMAYERMGDIAEAAGQYWNAIHLYRRAVIQSPSRFFNESIQKISEKERACCARVEGAIPAITPDAVIGLSVSKLQEHFRKVIADGDFDRLKGAATRSPDDPFVILSQIVFDMSIRMGDDRKRKWPEWQRAFERAISLNGTIETIWFEYYRACNSAKDKVNEVRAIETWKKLFPLGAEIGRPFSAIDLHRASKEKISIGDLPEALQLATLARRVEAGRTDYMPPLDRFQDTSDYYKLVLLTRAEVSLLIKTKQFESALAEAKKILSCTKAGKGEFLVAQVVHASGDFKSAKSMYGEVLKTMSEYSGTKNVRKRVAKMRGLAGKKKVPDTLDPLLNDDDLQWHEEWL